MAILLVDGGLDITTNRLKGAGTEPLNAGWGTGAQTTATRADTSLGPTTVEKDVDLTTNTGNRTVGASTRQTTNTTNDTYQVVATRTATGAGTVTCAGLFDNVTIGSGNMYTKADFVGVGLAIGDAIQFTWKVVYDN
jgi:hypothetical protein